MQVKITIWVEPFLKKLWEEEKKHLFYSFVVFPFLLSTGGLLGHLWLHTCKTSFFQRDTQTILAFGESKGRWVTSDRLDGAFVLVISTWQGCALVSKSMCCGSNVRFQPVSEAASASKGIGGCGRKRNTTGRSDSSGGNEVYHESQTFVSLYSAIFEMVCVKCTIKLLMRVGIISGVLRALPMYNLFATALMWRTLYCWQIVGRRFITYLKKR